MWWVTFIHVVTTVAVVCGWKLFPLRRVETMEVVTFDWENSAQCQERSDDFMAINTLVTGTKRSSTSKPSISAKKLKLIHISAKVQGQGSVDGYRLIDLNCLTNSLMAATACGRCKAHQMKITEEVVTSITFLLTCPCGATSDILTSKKPATEGANPSQCAFELNRRFIFIFHSIGLGFTAMLLFTVAMNIPFTMSKHT